MILKLENTLQLMATLSVKAKKKITISFRNHFDIAIGPRVLEMAF